MKSIPALLALTTALTVLAAAPVPAYAQQLRAGAAMTNITPPLGIPVIGNFGEMLALNVHDELHVRAVVVDDGKKKVAMAVCDLLGFRGMVSEEARRRIEEITGIPKEHVLVTATHTHSGGDALGNPHEQRENLTDYQKFVAHRVADAVAMADRRLRPAEAAFGKVDIPEHVFNRRWSMKEGTMSPNPFGKIDKARMNPPVGNPDLVEPVGPTDPTLSFVAFREPGGRLISLFAAYSLHYIGGGAYGDVSADYFAVFSEELKKMQPESPNPAAPAFVAPPHGCARRPSRRNRLRRVAVPRWRRARRAWPQPPRSSRPIRKRRISLVPAPMSYSLASRTKRSTGHSFV
ncbi:MAG: hypothetical protein EOP86_17925 [Verrucomicrobiaceae bacterium]|nr:MAG: hypothetical protein EOP86_17925 [Verrucomicrobiaceae bacterium]